MNGQGTHLGASTGVPSSYTSVSAWPAAPTRSTNLHAAEDEMRMQKGAGIASSACVWLPRLGAGGGVGLEVGGIVDAAEGVTGGAASPEGAGNACKETLQVAQRALKLCAKECSTPWPTHRMLPRLSTALDCSAPPMTCAHRAQQHSQLSITLSTQLSTAAFTA